MGNHQLHHLGGASLPERGGFFYALLRARIARLLGPGGSTTYRLRVYTNGVRRAPRG